MRSKSSWKALLPAFLILLMCIPSGAVPALDEAMQRLRSPDILISDAAVEAIGQSGPAGVDSLLAALGEPQRDVRAGAIRGLGLLKDARAVAPIMKILEGSLANRGPATFEDRYLRILAIQALGRLRAKEALGLLEQAAEGDAFEEAQAGVALFHLHENLGYSLVKKCLSDTT